MCGIGGIISEPGVPIERDILARMMSRLTHRGPDDSGLEVFGNVGLGFRRLAIIDLSPAGKQPMTSADGRYVITYNGEIYNFVELREDLERLGEHFRGHSDTEVLLRLYANYGLACLPMLNGMFAFAVYDRLEGTVTLARDRLGVKPLFCWQRGPLFAFGSELSALRLLPGFPARLNPAALSLYFRLGTVPEWTSIYPGVLKIPPGTSARFHIGESRLDAPVPYWSLPDVAEHEGKTEQQWVDEIEALLWDATRIRLRADVPLGVFLSGGIDSALVAAAASSQSHGLTSLTIGFPGESTDEVPLATATAEALGLDNITANVDLDRAIASLPNVMAHFDEPFSDTSALPTSMVCAEARKQFTVVLSGDGGDEAFAGYENHVRAWKWRFVDRLPLQPRRIVADALAALFPGDSVARRFFRRLGQPVGQFGLGGKVYPFQDWSTACLKPEFIGDPNAIVELYNRHLPQWGRSSSVDIAQRLDLRTYLLEDILVKVDRMSMLHSLEVRSPFLDYRMIELGLSVPSALRVKNGQTKYLLRRLAARHLPAAVCSAPKRGFGIPLQDWIRKDPNAFVFPKLHDNLDAFQPGRANRLLALAKANGALTSAVGIALSYAWWAEARSHESLRY